MDKFRESFGYFGKALECLPQDEPAQTEDQKRFHKEITPEVQRAFLAILQPQLFNKPKDKTRFEANIEFTSNGSFPWDRAYALLPELAKKSGGHPESSVRTLIVPQ